MGAIFSKGCFKSQGGIVWQISRSVSSVFNSLSVADHTRNAQFKHRELERASMVKPYQMTPPIKTHKINKHKKLYIQFAPLKSLKDAQSRAQIAGLLGMQTQTET